jgi:pimeloyl-ACP methyl ester carboxylesterase
MLDRRTTLGLGAGAFVAPPVVPVQAQAPAAPPLPYRAHTVRTPDGLQIAAYEYGNPQGPAILFIHGFGQAALSWDRQTRDPDLAREFRLVAYDFRGHGMSDKPIGDAYYKPGKPWGDEVRAVIEQTGLVRPVLVGWSYGGRVMGDYLTEHGQAAIGGLNFVAATTSSADATRFGRAGRHSGPAGMGSADPATAIRATVAFLRDCFDIQPSAEAFETMLAFNMMVPRHVRLALLGRPANYEAPLRALEVPVLVTHGELDRAVDISMGRYTAATARGAQASFWPHIGHAPFWEDAPRFNRELAALARSARRA